MRTPTMTINHRIHLLKANLAMEGPSLYAAVGLLKATTFSLQIAHVVEQMFFSYEISC